MISALLKRLAHAALIAMFAMGTIASAQDQLDALLGNNGGVMLSSPSGDILIAKNPDTPLVPASLVKIPLAHAALSRLGEGYRFKTEFYINSENDLLVRGLGDPFLVSEKIEVIARELAAAGLHAVNRLVMDDSAFEVQLTLPEERGADDPYAARNSALAVNFNTVNLAWSESGELISGESQTPLTEVARELGASLRLGNAQRINFRQDPILGLRQAHGLFLQFLHNEGIEVVDDSFHRESLSSGWTVFFVYANDQSLSETLRGLLRYSNNFIANQVFLVMGAESTGFPANVESARLVLQTELAALYGVGIGSDPSRLSMLEGSGLLRDQRTTARAMLTILRAFQPYAELLPDRDGVLRKSGTLTGVYNYAGYLKGRDGLYPFVILTNQAANNRDEILQLLRRAI